jgi:hypothetical protein
MLMAGSRTIQEKRKIEAPKGKRHTEHVQQQCCKMAGAYCRSEKDVF